MRILTVLCLALLSASSSLASLEPTATMKAIVIHQDGGPEVLKYAAYAWENRLKSRRGVESRE